MSKAKWDIKVGDRFVYLKTEDYHTDMTAGAIYVVAEKYGNEINFLDDALTKRTWNIQDWSESIKWLDSESPTEVVSSISHKGVAMELCEDGDFYLFTGGNRYLRVTQEQAQILQAMFESILAPSVGAIDIPEMFKLSK